jgi:hypothetical protein
MKFNSIVTLSLKFLLFKASQMGNQEIVSWLFMCQNAHYICFQVYKEDSFYDK